MRRLVMVVSAALLFVPLYFKSRSSQNISARPAFDVLSSGKVLVKVSGELRHPGIYETSANSMAISVIKLAEPLQPLQQLRGDTSVTVSQVGGAVNIFAGSDGTSHMTVDTMTVSERMVLGIPLDLAVMNEADFDRLPGIGPALARRIIEYRQQNGGIYAVSDLEGVEGIGKKKLEIIRRIVQPVINNK